ncbi:hypothetical protein DL766_003101 [Monosporascus sp. MC13-8B]|uniref:Uncharacterized protein n=1 Tax=Monosporascus cannonballus TaxID=155416 RepID=A0ABY0HE66_9PEZI|nr:hypothetical protein DL763_006694 [Monosporascus cannonballus]RYO88622.1 hypothetical protein DL762_003658 [Monosporascus cannonballus]RYP34200.1 hypothetical protein DL766_003101 [Monosporascus sp. MC13-8B]
MLVAVKIVSPERSVDTATTISTVAESVTAVENSVDEDALHKTATVRDSVNDEERGTWQGLVIPTKKEVSTLRCVAEKRPASCYYLCAVEFAERASYHGCSRCRTSSALRLLPGQHHGRQLQGLTVHGRRAGPGLHHLYCHAWGLQVPVVRAAHDLRLARRHQVRPIQDVCWDVAICGVAHVIMIISALPPMLRSSKAIGSSAPPLYMLSIAAAQFKLNISPTVIDHSPHKIAHILTDRRLARRSSSTPSSPSAASCCGITCSSTSAPASVFLPQIRPSNVGY